MVFLNPNKTKNEISSTEIEIAILATPILIISEENVWFLVFLIFSAKKK